MLIKISIVLIAFYFIYQKLINNTDFIDFLTQKKTFSFKNMLFLLLLSGFNWYFEIIKWQTLVTPLKRIGVMESVEQSLGALTASLFTPNRIGEYGAKAIYYPKAYRKHIVLINLISNLLQQSITVILGVLGLSLFILKYHIVAFNMKWVLWLIIILAILVLAVILLRKSKYFIKWIYFEKIKTFLLTYPKKTIAYGLGFSLLRYLLFSFQFYYLLTIFGIEISYLEAMPAITSMYILASAIPSIFIFDAVVKGSVAVFLFAFIGVNSITILSIVGIMWLFNFALPSIIGSYFVLKFKFPKDPILS
ncbi:lysylphosphatidylglycerol synthase domain-containing protein [Mariniflexile aquimaris]|uniref:Lysylphosphatidylglycerol synthase domain-containing protein n=1 Tax=Mariniflexile aquimaris TaxID=881009 RepID=A0ABW3BPF2_9FLAO